MILDASGALPTVTRTKLQEILASDHDCRAVFDGARPLAVSDLVHASQVPTKTRIAVELRDRTYRSLPWGTRLQRPSCPDPPSGPDPPEDRLL